MIWTRGEIIPDDALRISVLDRTFEHGLGLFETFRTWNGHATLLCPAPGSAAALGRELGLPLEPGHLPDARPSCGWSRRAAYSGANDIRLRITLSGGMATQDGLGADALDDRGAVAAADNRVGGAGSADRFTSTPMIRWHGTRRSTTGAGGSTRSGRQHEGSTRSCASRRTD